MADVAVPQEVDIHFQKSNFFRVVHADGAFGGLSPRGLINMAFYSERSPIPRRTKIEIANGVPGLETVVEVKTGIFREIEVDIVMDIAAAASFYAWLGQQIANAQAQLAVPQAVIDKMMGKGT
jgi:hypothetical protein